MSQLTGDFDEMMQQHERVAKEKMKENLLQQMAASSGTSVHQVRAAHGSNASNHPSSLGGWGHDSNFASPEDGARSTWRDGMSSSNSGVPSVVSNYTVEPLDWQRANMSSAVQSDLAQGRWNDLIGGVNNDPLLGGLVERIFDPQPFTISSSALQPQTNVGPHHHSIIDDDADLVALLHAQNAINDEYDLLDVEAYQERMWHDRIMRSHNLAQTSLADDLIERSRRPSTLALLAPSPLAIKDETTEQGIVKPSVEK